MASPEQTTDIEQGSVNEPTVSFTEGVAEVHEEEQTQQYVSEDRSVKTSEGVETLLYEEAPPTCWNRFRGEWKLQFFELSETDDSMIDVQRSFAAPPLRRTFFIKAILTIWAIALLVTDLFEDAWKPISYYFIFYANWSLAITAVYFFVSLTNTAIGIPEQRPYEDIPGLMVRLAWGLYPTAAVSQITGAILFWVLEHNATDSVTYKMVMKHGGLALLVVLEGRFVDCIPVRQKHLLFPMLFATLFVIWTIIHDLLGLGNPYNADSEAVYESLNWKESIPESIVVSVVLILCVTPLLFLNVWILSVWSFPFYFDGLNRHHYYLEEREKQASWCESMFGWAYKD